MDLEHTFTLPVAPDEAFAVLSDVEHVGTHLSDVTLSEVAGQVAEAKLTLRPAGKQVTYRGTVSVDERDQHAFRIVLRLDLEQVRGAGALVGTVTVAVRSEPGDSSRVEVVAALEVTGRAAELGHDALQGAGDELVAAYADGLRAELPQEAAATGAAPPSAAPVPDAVRAAATPVAPPAGWEPEPDPFVTDVAEPASGRVALGIGVMVLVGLVVWLVRRR